MSDDQNGIYRHTFFKKGRKVQNSALSWWTVLDWLRRAKIPHEIRDDGANTRQPGIQRNSDDFQTDY